jgi:hypothetical protein
MIKAVVYLDRNIWAKGELTEPKLNVVFPKPTESILTLSLALYDYNGVRVTDDYTTTIPVDTKIKVIELGDYLNAQQIAKGFGSGFYALIVKIVETGEVYALPLLVTLGYITPPFIPDREYLQHYTVFDKVAGTYVNLPPTMEYIPSDPKFLVYAYLHKENKGRLLGISEIGSIVFDTGYHQLAYMTITLKFNSIGEMITHMLAHSYGLTSNVAFNVMDAINNKDYDTALKLLRPFYMITFLGRMITAEFDTTNYEVRIKTIMHLGQWDWSKIFSWGAIACGAAMLGFAVLAGVTGGVGAITAPLVAKACVMGGVLGVGIAVATSISSDKPEKWREWTNIIIDEGEKAKQQNEQHFNDAKGILDNWLQQGKITQDDYNQMLKALQNWKTSMDVAIDDLVKVSTEQVKKAYKEGYDDGYKKGVDESKTWIVASGIGGLLVGLLIGRR